MTLMILMRQPTPKHSLIQKAKENLQYLALMNITLKLMMMNVGDKFLSTELLNVQ